MLAFSGRRLDRGRRRRIIRVVVNQPTARTTRHRVAVPSRIFRLRLDRFLMPTLIPHRSTEKRARENLVGRAIAFVLTTWWLVAGAPVGSRAENPALVGLDVSLDQRYCASEGKAGLCDVYRPKTEPPKSGFPAVLVVHGGGWMSGDKWTLDGYSRLLAKGGFVVVNINYRLAPEHPFPAQADDVREALLWTKSHAESWSLDLNRLGVFGYSAGGHLSVLIGSIADEPIEDRLLASHWSRDDKRWQALPKVTAVCAGGPPCDFRTLPIDNTAMSYFLGGSRRQKPEIYRVASPTAHASPADPITQIIHGESDLIVPIKSSRMFHEAQLAAGVDSRMKVINGQGHMITFLNPRTSRLVVEFFSEVFDVESPPISQ